jgi:hypothetical protein
MMNEKPTLKALLESSKGSKLLFLGQEGIFSKEERARYLKPYGVTAVDTIQEGVVGVIEHHRLNPVEEDISYEAYAQKIPAYKLTAFEQMLSEEIDDDALLMAIKLGNDQERLLRLLGNEHLSDVLFVRLLKLYRFHEDDEDNRQDRDVIMHTLRRYINIKPNEEDLLYSYLTLRRLATEATDPNLLEALLGFPDFSFLVRGKEKVTLRQTIAKNPAVNDALVRKLLSFRDRGVEQALAGNTSVPVEVLKVLFSRNDSDIDRALATNRSIDDALFGALLERDRETVALLLVRQPVDEARFGQILAASLAPELFMLIGANETLSETVKTHLLESADDALFAVFAANPTFDASALEMIYQKDLEEVMAALAGNPKTPRWILQTLYEEDNTAAALAANPATPQPLLEALFERNNFAINRALATNPSLPKALLSELMLDTRLQQELAQNPALAESFESVLKQEKVMLNI